MLDVLQELEPELVSRKTAVIRKMIPTFQKPINSDEALSKKILADTAKTLKLTK
jgi:hypothetical protein